MPCSSHSLITLFKKAKLWPLNATGTTTAFSSFREQWRAFRFLILCPRPISHHWTWVSVAFIRLAWLRPLSAPLCLILDYATYPCALSHIQDTEVIVYHYIFSGPTWKVLKRRLFRAVSHGSDHTHTGVKRHRFAFTLSSRMAAQDFNFLLATDSYKVRITWLGSFDNRNTKAHDSVFAILTVALCAVAVTFMCVKKQLWPCESMKFKWNHGSE